MKNKMGDMLKRLMRPLKKAPQDTKVSLEIGERAIKVAEVDISKKAGAVRLFKAELSSTEEGAVAQELASCFDKHAITKDSVSLNIPRHLVIARFLRLPSTNDEELKDMVKIEAVKQVPSTNEETVVGYKVIEKGPDGYAQILLAIAQGNDINRITGIARGAGLTIKRIAIGSESLSAWYSFVRGATKEGSNVPTAIINADPEYVDIDIIDNGKLVFTRAFSGTGQGPGAPKTIVDEIKRSILNHQKSGGSRVERIAISGQRELVEKVEPLARNELKIPLEAIDQADRIELDKSDGAAATGSFIELLGICLNDKEIAINLLPEEAVRENELAVLKNQVKATAVLSTAIVVIAIILAAKGLLDRANYVRYLDAEISRMEPTVIEAKKMKEDIKIMKDVAHAKPLAIDILSEIYKITPPGVTFTLLDYESGGTLVLRGNAASVDEVVRYSSLLERSDYLENAKVKYTTKRVAAGGEMTDFEIVCSLTHAPVHEPLTSFGFGTVRGSAKMR